MPPAFMKSCRSQVLMALAAIAGVYGLIYADLVVRAREAYQEAETYMEWDRNPDKKRAALDERYKFEKSRLERLLKKKETSPEEFQERMDALEFEREFALQESSLKYAYQWYKDTYELFSPPNSKWV